VFGNVRDDDRNFAIDPAELFRVFQPRRPAGDRLLTDQRPVSIWRRLFG
jgi:hypothetical protein